MSKLKLIQTIGHAGNIAKVYQDSEWQEWRVKFFIKGDYQDKADSHQDTKQDAIDTAFHWVDEADTKDRNSVTGARSAELIAERNHIMSALNVEGLINSVLHGSDLYDYLVEKGIDTHPKAWGAPKSIGQLIEWIDITCTNGELTSGDAAILHLLDVINCFQKFEDKS